MQMRPSRVLRKLRAGKVATCTKLNLADPRVAEIAGCEELLKEIHQNASRG